MKKLFFTWVLVSVAAVAAGQAVTDSSWREEVKTATLTRSGVELEAPLLTMGGGERMLLQFDLLADEVESLRYTIGHCDAEWRRDGLEPYEYMTGFESGEIENYDLSITTLRPRAISRWRRRFMFIRPISRPPSRAEVVLEEMERILNRPW